MKPTLLIVSGAMVLLAGAGAYAWMSRPDSIMEKTTDTMMAGTDAGKDIVIADDTMAKDAADENMAKDVMMDKGEDQSKDSLVAADTMMKADSRYVPFSPTALSQAAGSRRVLFFYANWCPTCKPADADFTANAAQLPSDVTLIRVNYNDTETDQAEKDLAKKYGVTYQHTYVQLDAQGNVVTKWNGGQMKELLERIK